VLGTKPSGEAALGSLTADTELAESISWAVLSSYKVMVSRYLALLGAGRMRVFRGLPERV
jgi:hypothetical protein